MAFSWGLPCRADGEAVYWSDVDGDQTHELFGQFVDYNGEAASVNNASASASTMAIANDGYASPGTRPRLADTALLEYHEHQQHVLAQQQSSRTQEHQYHVHHPPGSATSSGMSTADEFDFLSTSSQHELDIALSGASSQPQYIAGNGLAQPPQHLSRASVSESDLPRLEDFTLQSSPRKRQTPSKKGQSSQPTSPTPQQATKGNKFMNAVSSTIKRATNLRKPRKDAPFESIAAPVIDRPAEAMHASKHRTVSLSPTRVSSQQTSPRRAQHHAQARAQHIPQHSFVHGDCDDPFQEASPLTHVAGPVSYFQPADGSRTPGDTEGFGQADEVPPSWPLPDNWDQQHLQGAGPGWWDPNAMVNQPNNHGTSLMSSTSHQVMTPNHNVQLSMAQRQQHQSMEQDEYSYSNGLAEIGNQGLMIRMPGQPPVPHPGPQQLLNQPPPPCLPPPTPATERPHRPPRARSSGTRRMSSSPLRKTRLPSASPGPGQSRQSSGSSGRSVSARSLPGTPSSVRKRRSRETSGSFGGETGGGFVNFTPSDGGMLMTGVAPSGSSKTKARREKEAQERRRKLSEAALKAVAAAGGDVKTLVEQGFTF